MRNQLIRAARRDRRPGGVWLIFRAAAVTLWTPVIRVRHRWRLLRLRHSSTDRPRQWGSRPWMMVVTAVTVILSAVFALWLARAAVVVAIGHKWAFPDNFDPDLRCNGIGTSCGAITGWITSLLSLALAAMVFLLWRFWRVQRWYRRKARKDSRDLVPTAGTIFGRIVGRNDLCRVVMEDLRDRHARRPHVLVGGVGTGKTTVLVQLTEMLAEHGAVPVPIRLRDADRLNFAELAENRFRQLVNEHLASGAEGEKTWRRLLRDNRIVILADGLEEALPGTTDTEERDTKIRLAIHEAHEQHLPLLITSRPHAQLQDMDATIYELEPLNQDDALDYIEEGRSAEDERRLRWITEIADVTEAPLYLQIMKKIYDQDMLDQIAPREAEILERASHDRSQLRLQLLRTWDEALVRGQLYPEVPLKPEDRRATLDLLSALACIGLKNDSIQVSLDSSEIAKIFYRFPSQRTGGRDGREAASVTDTRIAAAWGARLGIVEPVAGGIRFQHSLIQAYLGSRIMGTALRDHEYMTAALTATPATGRPFDHSRARGRGHSAASHRADARAQDQEGEKVRPGREFLISLVLYSRAHAQRGAAPAHRPAQHGQVPFAAAILRRLRKAARDHLDDGLDSKALDIYAAALEIGSVVQVRPPDPSSDGRARTRSPIHSTAAGTQAGDLGNPVQASASPGAATITRDRAASDAAKTTLSLKEEISSSWSRFRSGDPQTLEEAKLGLVRRFGESLRSEDENDSHEHGQHTKRRGYADLYGICRAEDSYRVRLTAAQEIGLGGVSAYQQLEDYQPLSPPQTHCRKCAREAAGGRKRNARRPASDTEHWARQVSAWLAPLLIVSIDADSESPARNKIYRSAREGLEQWVSHVRPDDPDCDGLTISEEIALAQGFKYAANRRHGHLHFQPRSSGYLQTEALEMLKRARYWFSQFTLLQALCLWQIDTSESSAEGGTANPDAIVNHWLDEIDSADRPRAAGSRHFHPFVEATALLATRALETGHPERFLWMDESEVVARVGSSQQGTDGQHRRHDRWILPWMGWSGLDPRAQQLVADVLLLLNLAERGDEPAEMDKWLRRADRKDIPLCFTQDRRAMKPECTVGTAEQNPPGDACLDGCPFDLCPYPPKGLQRPRAELGEAFCRHQYMLVRRARPGRRTAPWQGLRASQMRTFWEAMADRIRTRPA